MNKVLNGDLVGCSKCQCLHRLYTPKSRKTGQLVHGVLVYECCGALKVGFKDGELTEGLETKEPVGDKEWSKNDIYKKGGSNWTSRS